MASASFQSLELRARSRSWTSARTSAGQVSASGFLQNIPSTWPSRSSSRAPERASGPRCSSSARLTERERSNRQPIAFALLKSSSIASRNAASAAATSAATGPVGGGASSRLHTPARSSGERNL